jgi:hypothetical protein
MGSPSFFRWQEQFGWALHKAQFAYQAAMLPQMTSFGNFFRSALMEAKLHLD